MTLRRPTPFAALLAVLLSSCTGTRFLVDPVVQVHTQNGKELGVATDFGLVFLGRTSQSGDVDVVVWYGDGPSVEPSVIEPVGGGLYTAEIEIRMPSVPISFTDLADGTEVLVKGRDDEGEWEEEVLVRRDARVEGLLLEVPDRLRNAPSQLGAGVFLLPDEYRRGWDKRRHMRLVGLVSGRLVLHTVEGAVEYLTAADSRTLWRIATHRRDPEPPRWIYREDVL